MSAVVEFRDVRKTYHGRRGWSEIISTAGEAEKAVVRAVDGVSFALHPGKVLGLVGESGSGKSTLANLLVGLERPTEGEILFEGRSTRDLRGPELSSFRSSVQMVFQDPYGSLNPRFSIGRTIEEPLVIHRRGDRRERRERTIEALDEAELRPAHSYLDRYPHELSGGQRQRVAIARALVLKPRVLLADEPVSMLDVSVRAGILHLLKRLVTRHDMALVFITHDLSLIGQMCDQLAIMYRGRFVEHGESRGILQRQLHPYTKQLFAAVPIPDPDVPPRPVSTRLLQASAPPPRACSFFPRCEFATDHCRANQPDLRKIGAWHRAACHHAELIEAGMDTSRGNELA